MDFICCATEGSSAYLAETPRLEIIRCRGRAFLASTTKNTVAAPQEEAAKTARHVDFFAATHEKKLVAAPQREAVHT